MIKTNSITTLFLFLSIITSVISNFFSSLSNSDEILTIVYLIFIFIMLLRNKGNIDVFFLLLCNCHNNYNNYRVVIKSLLWVSNYNISKNGRHIDEYENIDYLYFLLWHQFS